MVLFKSANSVLATSWEQVHDRYLNSDSFTKILSTILPIWLGYLKDLWQVLKPIKSHLSSKYENSLQPLARFQDLCLCMSCCLLFSETPLSFSLCTSLVLGGLKPPGVSGRWSCLCCYSKWSKPLFDHIEVKSLCRTHSCVTAFFTQL